MAQYITAVGASTYVNDILSSDNGKIAWVDASVAERNQALTMATRAIDRLDFQGAKAVSTQELEFPRGDDTVVPVDIQNASIELALRFLDDVDSEIEDEGLRVKAQGYASARITYDSEFIPVHTHSGIPSKRAWAFLKPYLRDIEQLDLSRVS